MSDFVSTLTGQQIDSALNDMAMHNSEAYAVGERSGVVVTSGDPTYKNNAKYYAALAASQITGTVTDAVRWDTDQTSLLTGQQKLQARNNINAAQNGAWSNPNLLDNPWWGQGEVINQRSFTSLSGAGAFYTIDRWDRTSNSSLALTLTNSGIRFTLSSNGSWTFFRQYIGRKINEDATYTFSIMDDDGNIYSATGQFVTGTSSETYVNIGGMSLGLGMYGKGVKPYVALGFGTNRAGEFTIRAVKLELGTVSTLANDTPPNYADELDRCQYYFERISAGTANLTIGTGIGTGSYFYTPIKLHPKRTAPTVTYSGSVGIGRSAYETDISAIYTSGCSSDPNSGNYNLAVTVTNTTQTAYRLIIKTGGYIDFSADL